MGYNHYFTVLRRDDLRIEEIGHDIALLIENSDVPIVDGMGNPNTSPDHNIGALLPQDD